MTTALLLLGASAGAIGFSVQPAIRGAVGPGTLALDPGVRLGSTVVALPPLGEVIADTHDGPLAVDARVDRIDLDQASSLVRGGDPVADLRDQVESDLGPLLWRLGRQSAVVALASGLVAGFLLPRRGRRAIATVVVGSVGFVAVGGAVAWNSFDPRSFDRPRFEGALARAPDVVSTVQRHIDDVGAVESRLESLSDRIVDLYRTVEGDTGPIVSDTRILHVTDLHSNPVGIALVEETAERFDVDAIIDTGDLTSFGTDVETVVVDQVARIDTPYYVVPGNHDSFAIRQALRDAGVEVLDGRVVTIGGIDVLGAADPTYTAENTVSRDRYTRQVERAAAVLNRMVRRQRPQVVAVHNPLQLVPALGKFDVGLTGHRHDPDLRYEEGSVVVQGGSAGATGVGALMTDEDLPYQMQLLHFDDGELRAVDRLEFQGTDGAFQLQRLLVDASRVEGYSGVPADAGPLLGPPPVR